MARGMPYVVGSSREKCLDSRFQPRLDWHSGRVTCDNRQTTERPARQRQLLGFFAHAV